MLDAHEEAGISHAVVSDSFYMENAAEELPSWSSVDRARLYNDSLADLIARHKGRLYGLGCIDPFAGDAAAKELERMVRELGFHGALVNPTQGERYLDDPVCASLLAAAEHMGCPLFIHPSRDLPCGQHYEDFVMSLIVGRPTQTAICACRLIFTGTLDRYPALRLLLAHGGGVLPYVSGRLDATWAAYRPERWRGPDLLTKPPSTYIERFHVDTNLWSAPAVKLLLEVVGSKRIVFGTDLPPVWYPIRESIQTIAAAAMTAEDREAILAGNAQRLFGLSTT